MRQPRLRVMVMVSRGHLLGGHRRCGPLDTHHVLLLLLLLLLMMMGMRVMLLRRGRDRLMRGEGRAGVGGGRLNGIFDAPGNYRLRVICGRRKLVRDRRLEFHSSLCCMHGARLLLLLMLPVVKSEVSLSRRCVLALSVTGRLTRLHLPLFFHGQVGGRCRPLH